MTGRGGREDKRKGGWEGRREEERRGDEREGERRDQVSALTVNGGKWESVLFCAIIFCLLYVYLYSDGFDVLMYTSYIHPLVYVPDSSHEVVDCCNVVVVHFNVHVWVDPPGRERWREER